MYGNRCFLIGASLLPTPGFAEVYANNTCILSPGSECLNFGQAAAGFPAPAEFHTRTAVYNNTIYTTSGADCPVVGGAFKTMTEFQSGGYEAGPASTIVSTLPDADT